jgi:hypothetical protein
MCDVPSIIIIIIYYYYYENFVTVLFYFSRLSISSKKYIPEYKKLKSSRQYYTHLWKFWNKTNVMRFLVFVALFQPVKFTLKRNLLRIEIIKLPNNPAE